MKNKFLIFATALLAVGCGSPERSEDLTQYVDPNIGSIHSRWFFYTPAAEPFGLAKLGASTNGSYSNEQGWEAVGYEDGHTSIEGFPCFHEFQVGGLMLMPAVGEVKTQPGKLDDPDGGYRSRFDKADEYATAGYYSVLLKDYGVRAELTATARVGFQRYTFPATTQARVIFDVGNRLGESGPVKDAMVEIVGPQTVQGYIVTEPTYVDRYDKGATVNMYFYAEIDKPAVRAETFFRGGEVGGAPRLEGVGACAVLTYETVQDEEMTVKIGLSYTSIENARANLEAEAAGLSFDDAKAQTHDLWQEYLSRLEVEGGTPEARTKFYTGLYHALLGRGIASDVNGDYPKNDGTVGRIPAGEDGRPQYNLYNTDAVWGSYWNLNLLWALAYPEYYNDFVRSQVQIYRDTGWLGDGVANSKFVSGVGTNMTSILLAGAYQCGIRDYDVEEAYQAALKNEIGWKDRLDGAGKADVGRFVELGYSPYVPDHDNFKYRSEGSQFSASHTLEYSFSSYAVAQWAKALGKDEDYEKLMWLSKGWERLFDPETRLIRPRTPDGGFIDNFNPLESWRGFQEGNAVQYTFFVPHDPAGLIGKLGGEAFNNRLDSIFTEARKNVFGGGKTVYAFAGIQSPYNHGNQPNLHISWLFNFSGKPYLTQKWTRLICDEFYGTDGEHGYGYGQDEDQGQLGAWYVMAGMGLFDIQGGVCTRPTFQIGSPQFDRIRIRNGKGWHFTVETENNAPDAYYVQSATLDGEPLDDCWFYRDQMRDGGVLRLKMGPEPNPAWGAETAPACSR